MTAHIEANKEDIANIVIMPGDPLRAKFIAENFLTDYKCINTVRSMFGYTGFFEGKRITVMASGMGNASMGIYSYELYKFYDVDYIIRVGSSGSYSKDLNIYDMFLATTTYSESSYAHSMNGCDSNLINSSEILNDKIIETAIDMNLKLKTGVIHCSDVFYKTNNNYVDLFEKYNCMCVEMESFALFTNASELNKHAACIVTISDSFITNEVTTSKERQENFKEMMKLALTTATKL